MRAVRRLTSWAPLAAAFALAACDEPVAPDSSPTQFVSIAAGDAQLGSIGVALPDSPTVVVRDRSGQPQAGVPVEWRVLEGGGEVSQALTVTDAQGQARVAWTLGEDAGRNLLMASVRESPAVTFRADADIRYRRASAGRRHTCALDALGNAYCWGNDQWGQLGNAAAGASAVPARVAGGYRFERIDAGVQHTCALTAAGEAMCWGENGDGQLGNGTQVSSSSPVLVSGGHRFAAIDAGGVHTCAVTTAGAVYCWGSNDVGEIGADVGTCTRAGSTWPCARTPVQVALPASASAVATGDAHSCALLTDGRAYCWGWNSWGELGVGRFGGTVTRPEAVSGTVRFRTLSAGSFNTCGVATTGLAYCWGMNRGGMLGNGGTLNFSAPNRVASEELFRTVELGLDHACGITEKNEVYCWGALTGDPSIPTSPRPVQVRKDPPFLAVTVGGAHACATDNAAIWCWGSNADGQLGSPAAGARAAAPVRIVTALPSTP